VNDVSLVYEAKGAQKIVHDGDNVLVIYLRVRNGVKQLLEV